MSWVAVKCWYKWYIQNPLKDFWDWVNYATPMPDLKVYWAMCQACKILNKEKNKCLD